MSPAPSPKALGLPHLSASQIDNYDPAAGDGGKGCPRKWAFERLDHCPRLETSAFADGQAIHLLMETWFLRGVPPHVAVEEAGFADACRTKRATVLEQGSPLIRTAEGMVARLAAEGLGPHLVRPGGLEVEKFFAVTSGIVRVVGYLDLFHRATEHGPALICDHKSTSSMSWAKDKEELAEHDTQSVIYAAWGMLDSKRPEVSLWWSYGVKGTKKGQIVKSHTTAEQLGDRFDEIFAVGHEMICTWIAWRLTQPEVPPTILNLASFDGIAPLEKTRGYYALSLAPNPLACTAYGGCPHRERCGEIPSETMADILARTFR